MKEKLARLGIATVEDLISFYPRRYQDWTKITKMEELRPDDEAVITAGWRICGCSRQGGA